MEDTTPSRDLITEAELAAEVHMAPKTLANQRSRGEGFPYVRLPGGRIRYSRKAIAECLAAGTVTPGAGRV